MRRNTGSKTYIKQNRYNKDKSKERLLKDWGEKESYICNSWEKQQEEHL